MPIHFHELACKTNVTYSTTPNGVSLHIETPRLNIRSVTVDDIDFYQSLWANTDVMEQFAEGLPRLYSGTPHEKEDKTKNQEPYDYARWRLKESDNSWLKRLLNGDIWSGLTILTKNGDKIGHIVIGGGELAYFLMPLEWNKGYTSEAAAALTRIALPILITEHHVYDPGEITATVRKNHLFSQKVLKNAGLELSSHLNTKILNGKNIERYEATTSTRALIETYKKWQQSVAIIPSPKPTFFHPTSLPSTTPQTTEDNCSFTAHHMT